MSETERRGRKPVYDTPQKFRAAVYKYIEECTGSGVFPDYALMRRALGLHEKDIEALVSSGNENCEEYKEVLEEAKDFRESWLCRKMSSDNKAANGCMNLLKQPENGGYVDKQTDKTPQKVIVDFSGMPGGMNAFK